MPWNSWPDDIADTPVGILQLPVAAGTDVNRNEQRMRRPLTMSEPLALAEYWALDAGL